MEKDNAGSGQWIWTVKIIVYRLTAKKVRVEIGSDDFHLLRQRNGRWLIREADGNLFLDQKFRSWQRAYSFLCNAKLPE